MRTVEPLLCRRPFLICSSDGFGQGKYRIGNDKAGMYFQTDRDGGWHPKIRPKIFPGSANKGLTLRGRMQADFVQIDGDRKFMSNPP